MQEQADQLDKAGKLPQALAQRQEALGLMPDDVWLAYRVAATQARLGDAAGGERLLRGRLAPYCRRHDGLGLNQSFHAP